MFRIVALAGRNRKLSRRGQSSWTNGYRARGRYSTPAEAAKSRERGSWGFERKRRGQIKYVSLLIDGTSHYYDAEVLPIPVTARRPPLRQSTNAHPPAVAALAKRNAASSAFNIEKNPSRSNSAPATMCKILKRSWGDGKMGGISRNLLFPDLRISLFAPNPHLLAVSNAPGRVSK